MLDNPRMKTAGDVMKQQFRMNQPWSVDGAQALATHRAARGRNEQRHDQNVALNKALEVFAGSGPSNVAALAAAGLLGVAAPVAAGVALVGIAAAGAAVSMRRENIDPNAPRPQAPPTDSYDFT